MKTQGEILTELEVIQKDLEDLLNSVDTLIREIEE